MRLDNGEESRRTKTGACCSIFVLFFTILYGLMKLGELILRDDVDVLQTVQDKVFSRFDNFTYDDGFDFAFGFSTFGGPFIWELDPSYGELVLQAQSWHLKENLIGSYAGSEELKTHTCSDVELGLKHGKEDGEVSRFF